MKVLLVGGSGKVGTLITPYLLKDHAIRVLDIKPPAAHGVEFVEGSICDVSALSKALSGCDTFINLVMMGAQGGSVRDQSVELIQSNYSVNTLGLHLLLFTAHSMDIKFGVHTSTMSVHFRDRKRTENFRFCDEIAVPLDSPSVYGLSKGLGELICKYFATWFDMSIVALRITAPSTRKEYLDARKNRPLDFTGPLFVTDEEDLARAYHSALGFASTHKKDFQPFFISGDENQIDHNMSKAQRLLGWSPRSHLILENKNNN